MDRRSRDEHARTAYRAILMRPREPFFQWLRETGGHTPTAIEQRRGRLYVVLMAGDRKRSCTELDGPLLRDIAERHLAEVCPDRTRWPAFASLSDLSEWFACQDDVDVYEIPGE